MRGVALVRSVLAIALLTMSIGPMPVRAIAEQEIYTRTERGLYRYDGVLATDFFPAAVGDTLRLYSMSDSNIAVQYESLTPETCTVTSGPSVSANTFGICTIRIWNAGNNNWAPFSEQKNIYITKRERLTITIRRPSGAIRTDGLVSAGDTVVAKIWAEDASATSCTALFTNSAIRVQALAGEIQVDGSCIVEKRVGGLDLGARYYAVDAWAARGYPADASPSYDDYFRKYPAYPDGNRPELQASHVCTNDFSMNLGVRVSALYNDGSYSALNVQVMSEAHTYDPDYFLWWNKPRIPAQSDLRTVPTVCPGWVDPDYPSFTHIGFDDSAPAYSFLQEDPESWDFRDWAVGNRVGTEGRPWEVFVPPALRTPSGDDPGFIERDTLWFDFKTADYPWGGYWSGYDGVTAFNKGGWAQRFGMSRDEDAWDLSIRFPGRLPDINEVVAGAKLPAESVFACPGVFSTFFNSCYLIDEEPASVTGQVSEGLYAVMPKSVPSLFTGSDTLEWEFDVFGEGAESCAYQWSESIYSEVVYAQGAGTVAEGGAVCRIPAAGIPEGPRHLEVQVAYAGEKWSEYIFDAWAASAPPIDEGALEVSEGGGVVFDLDSNAPVAANFSIESTEAPTIARLSSGASPAVVSGCNSAQTSSLSDGLGGDIGIIGLRCPLGPGSYLLEGEVTLPDGTTTTVRNEFSVAPQSGILRQTSAPILMSGQPWVGGTFYGVPAEWTGLNHMTATRGHQWYQCSTAGSGSATGVPRGCRRIVGATTMTYRPTTADVGRYLRLASTISGVSSAALSAASQQVEIFPRVVRQPSVAGSSTLRATKGTWIASPSTVFKYQWLSCVSKPVASGVLGEPPTGCYEIADAISSSHRVDRVKFKNWWIIVRVTAESPLGSADFYSVKATFVR